MKSDLETEQKLNDKVPEKINFNVGYQTLLLLKKTLNKKNLEAYIVKWEFHCLKLRTMLKRGLKFKQPLLWRMRERRNLENRPRRI